MANEMKKRKEKGKKKFFLTFILNVESEPIKGLETAEPCARTGIPHRIQKGKVNMVEHTSLNRGKSSVVLKQSHCCQK